MICSPTEKGVVVIGGEKIFENERRSELSSDLIELSGSTIETLKWTILEQKLKYPRFYHVSFSIPNDTADDLTRKYVNGE